MLSTRLIIAKGKLSHSSAIIAIIRHISRIFTVQIVVSLFLPLSFYFYPHNFFITESFFLRESSQLFFRHQLFEAAFSYKVSMLFFHFTWRHAIFLWQRCIFLHTDSCVTRVYASFRQNRLSTYRDEYYLILSRYLAHGLQRYEKKKKTGTKP